MMNTIPKEFATSRPRNMAHKPRRFNSAHRLFTAVALLSFLVILGGCAAFMQRIAPLGSPVAPALMVTLTPFQPVTNTPIDTITPMPTGTPWPSFTPTVKPSQTRVPSETPLPSLTPTPAPSATLTPLPTSTPTDAVAAAVAAYQEALKRKQAQDLELQMRNAEIGMRLKEFFFSPAVIVVGLVILSGGLGTWFVVRWTNRKMSQAQGHETRAELEAQADEQVDERLVLILELLDYSAAIFDAGGARLAGWRDLEPRDSKWSADFWGGVISDLEALGLRTVRQSGKGTFLMGNTVRTARLFVRRLMVTPSPPSETPVL